MRTWPALPIVAVGILTFAACSGSGDSTGPDPNAVATVEITLPPGLLIGDSITAVVVLKNAAGTVLTGKTVNFTSSLPAVAAVNGAGLVLGLGAGGPVTITASAESKSASATVTVRDDQRFGYAWADQATSASYTPSASYANSTSGAITVTRSGTGSYAVRLAGLGRLDGQRENVQVTSYAELAFCGIASWQTQGADLVVNVLCFSPAGAAMDSRYTVMVTGARALTGRVGFLLADQAATGSYQPALRYNSGNGTSMVIRNSAGQYSVTFNGLARVSGTEMVMVTQVGSATNRCVVASWNYNGFTANITCTDRAGTPTDAQFSLLVMAGGRTGQRTGFAWANDMTTTDYTPTSSYTLNSANLAVTAHRSSVGVYQMNWDGLVKGTGTETVLVTAYGASDRFCRTSFWGMSTPTTFQVNVACFDPTGAPADSRFDIITIQ